MDDPIKHLFNNFEHVKPSISEMWISFLFFIPVADIKIIGISAKYPFSPAFIDYWNYKCHQNLHPPPNYFFLFLNLSIIRRPCLVPSSWKFGCGGSGIKMMRPLKEETNGKSWRVGPRQALVLVFPRVSTQEIRLWWTLDVPCAQPLPRVAVSLCSSLSWPT